MTPIWPVAVRVKPLFAFELWSRTAVRMKQENNKWIDDDSATNAENLKKPETA